MEEQIRLEGHRPMKEIMPKILLILLIIAFVGYLIYYFTTPVQYARREVERVLRYAVTGEERNGESYPAFRNEDLAGYTFVKVELVSNSTFADYDNYGKPKDYARREYIFTYDMKMKNGNVKRATVEIIGLDNHFRVDDIKY